jgi:hypothetical protein
LLTIISHVSPFSFPRVAEGHVWFICVYLRLILFRSFRARLKKLLNYRPLPAPRPLSPPLRPPLTGALEGCAAGALAVPPEDIVPMLEERPPDEPIDPQPRIPPSMLELAGE